MQNLHAALCRIDPSKREIFPIPIGSNIILGRTANSDSRNLMKFNLGIDRKENGISRNHATLMVNQEGIATLKILSGALHPLRIKFNDKVKILKPGKEMILHSGCIITFDLYNEVPNYSYEIQISNMQPYKSPAEVSEDATDGKKIKLDAKKSLRVAEIDNKDARNSESKKRKIDDVTQGIQTKNDIDDDIDSYYDYDDEESIFNNGIKKKANVEKTNVEDERLPLVIKQTSTDTQPSKRHKFLVSNKFIKITKPSFNSSLMKPNFSDKKKNRVTTQSNLPSERKLKVAHVEECSSGHNSDQSDDSHYSNFKKTTTNMSHYLETAFRLYLDSPDPQGAAAALCHQMRAHARIPSAEFFEELIMCALSDETSMTHSTVLLNCVRDYFEYSPTCWQPRDWNQLEHILCYECKKPNQFQVKVEVIDLMSYLYSSSMHCSAQISLLSDPTCQSDIVRKLTSITTEHWKKATSEDDFMMCMSLTKLSIAVNQLILVIGHFREATIARWCLEYLRPMIRQHPNSLKEILGCMNIYGWMPACLCKELLKCMRISKDGNGCDSIEKLETFVKSLIDNFECDAEKKTELE